MSKLEIVLFLLLLLAIPPIVVVMYVLRTVRRAEPRIHALAVEVHPSEPTRGAALRFVLRARESGEPVVVRAIVIDGALQRAMDLRPPSGFTETPPDATAAPFEPDVEAPPLDRVTWTGALEVTRGGVEVRVPGRSDPRARGRIAFWVDTGDGTGGTVEGPAVHWPEDLHG